MRVFGQIYRSHECKPDDDNGTKTEEYRMRRVKKSLSNWVVLMVVLGTACQDPMAPVDEPPAPRPTPALLHNAAVVLRRIDIEGACDGKDLFGDERKGHFAYRVRVRENPVAGTFANHTLESNDYGDALGQNFLRKSGESIDLNDRTYVIYGLSESESVTISLFGIEWDVLSRDSGMDGSGNSQTRRYSRDGREYYELDLGSGSCKIELEYAIDWSTP